jgi:molybdopterin/thiamine biosynthesis adenylyltransferase/rhodanese-related sulfurtransferase
MMMQLSQDEILRYSRHLILPEVGLEGQLKLKSASVLVVGTGGLGSPVAMYLAAAGVGRIGLVDYDVVEVSNLQRQVIHGTERIGQLKVVSASTRLLDINPFLKVDIYNQIFNSENAQEIAAPYDILVDCTDNFPTRYLINDLAVLTGKVYVYGSVFRFEGQVSVFDARNGPCYRCLFPEPPPPGLVPGCADGGVFGVLPGTIGTIQATEVIKLISGVGSSMRGKLMLYDAMDMSFQMINLRKNPKCSVCGPNPSVTHLIDYEAFCGTPANDHGDILVDAEWDLTPSQLAERLLTGSSLTLVDVREEVEQQISHLPGAILIPYGEIASRMDELDTAQEIVLFCRTGVRSTRALQVLRAAGFLHVMNLRGGINAWVKEIDTTMMVY